MRSQRMTLLAVGGVLAAAAVVLVVVLTRPPAEIIDDRPPAEWDPDTQKRVSDIRYTIENKIRSGQFAGAREVLIRHLRLYPKDPRGPYFMAMLLIGEDQETNRAEALKQLKQSLEMDASDHEGWFMASGLADDLGQIDQAADMMDRARKLSPQTTRYTLYLGTFRLKQGRIQEGRRWLQKALALDSDLAAAHGALAMSLVDDDPAGSMKHLSEALRLMGEDHDKFDDYLLLKAALHNRLKQPNDARRLLHHIMAKRRDEPVTREMARSYRLSGDPLKAAFTWADLSDANPEKGPFAIEAARAFLDAAEAGKPDLATARRLLQRAENLLPADPALASFKARLAKLNKP